MSENQTDAEKHFDVIFECDAQNEGVMRHEMAVRMIKPDHLEFALASDEGKFHGGGGTAPPPLAFFAAGLVSCLMTQLRAFSKRMGIPVTSIKAHIRLHWEGRRRGRAPYVSDPVGFAIDIEVGGDASDADKARLIDAAKNGCFAERTLMRPKTIIHRLRTDTGWIDV